MGILGGMEKTRSNIRRFANIALLLVCAPVVGDWFSELAREQGFYTHPTARVVWVMNTVANAISQPWFLFVAGAVGGFTAGVWLDTLLRRRNEREQRRVAIPEILMLVFGLGFLGSGIWYILAKKHQDASPVAAVTQDSAGSQTPASYADKEAARRAKFLTRRRALEEPLVGAEGTLVTHVFDADGIGTIELSDGTSTYKVPISKSGGTDVWVYNTDPSIKTIARVAEAKRGELIDVRMLRPAQGSESVRIGQHVFITASDGRTIQLMPVGILYYNAGDDRNEARFKYKVYGVGEFLIKAL